MTGEAPVPHPIAARARRAVLFARTAPLCCALAAVPFAAAAETTCRILADFDDPVANERWTMRNDDVMGGRSEGGVRFEDSAMVFSGDIHTNGGGFSSVRLKLLETLTSPATTGSCCA